MFYEQFEDEKARKRENEKWRSLIEDGYMPEREDRWRVVYKHDGHGWKRALVQQLTVFDKGEGEQRVWRTDRAVKVESEDKARYAASLAGATRSDSQPEFKKVKSGFRRQPLTDFEEKVWAATTWLHDNGWSSVAELGRLLLVPGAFHVKNPPSFS